MKLSLRTTMGLTTARTQDENPTNIIKRLADTEVIDERPKKKGIKSNLFPDYHGKTQREYQDFFYLIKIIFRLDLERFSNDKIKILYTSQYLKGELKKN